MRRPHPATGPHHGEGAAGHRLAPRLGRRDQGREAGVGVGESTDTARKARERGLGRGLRGMGRGWESRWKRAGEGLGRAGGPAQGRGLPWVPLETPHLHGDPAALWG